MDSKTQDQCEACEKFFDADDLEEGLCEECIAAMRWGLVSELSVDIMQWLIRDARLRKIDPAIHLDTLLRLVKAKQLIGVDICPAPQRKATQ